MMSIHGRALLCALAAAVLTGCGGGGAGSSATTDSDLVDNTLYVSLTYGSATVPLFGASTVTPTASGFQGRTPRCSLASGSLPPGMVLNADCSITGRPTSA